LREKLAAEEALHRIKSSMEERNMLVEELDLIILKYRDDLNILEKNHSVITKVLENTEELLQKRTEDLEFY
jgi:hypothetical protein